MLVFIFFLVLCYQMNAQGLKPTFYPAANGFFIEFNRQIQKNQYYIIFRQDNNNLTKIAEIRYPEKFEDFYNRVKIATSKFGIYDLPNSNELSRIWDASVKGQDVYSISGISAFPNVKEALGFGFYDNTLKTNNTYVYKIQLFGAKNRLITEFQSQKLTFKKQLANIKFKSSYASATETSTHLTYSSHVTNRTSKLKTFRNIYLQTDFSEIFPSLTFSTIKDSLYSKIYDSGVLKNLVYQYYTVPYDLYGNPGYNSDTVKIVTSSRTMTSHIKSIRAKSVGDFNSIQLAWNYHSPKYVRGVKIYKSKKLDGEYRLIATLSYRDTVFFDKEVNPFESYFYFIMVDDIFGNTIGGPRVGGLLVVSKPAEPPRNIRVQPEPNGVRVKWEKPTNDTRGYFVYRSTTFPGDSLIQISSLIQSDALECEFFDSLKNVVSPIVSYAVSSVNSCYQVSQPSKIVYSKNPLKLSVPTPGNIYGMLENGLVHLFWEQNSIETNSIAGYKIFRKTLKQDGSDSTDFVEMKRQITEFGSNSFLDSNLKPGLTYLYVIKSIGLNGSESPLSAPFKIYIPVEKPISVSSCSAIKVPEGVYIKWQPTLQSGIKAYRIYRLWGNNSPIKVAELDTQQKEFLDKFNPMGQKVFYAITCVNKNNIESEILEWFKSAD
jgi:hypothetical protein